MFVEALVNKNSDSLETNMTIGISSLERKFESGSEKESNVFVSTVEVDGEFMNRASLARNEEESDICNVCLCRSKVCSRITQFCMFRSKRRIGPEGKEL